MRKRWKWYPNAIRINEKCNIKAFRNQQGNRELIRGNGASGRTYDTSTISKGVRVISSLRKPDGRGKYLSLCQTPCKQEVRTNAEVDTKKW